MRPQLLRTVLRFGIVLFPATAMAVAQNPAENALPNAPTPASAPTTENLGTVATTEPARARPTFSTSLTTREKYALAYRRIVSPQMPLKATFVSGFELAAHTGPDFGTNGWGPFGERVGYNALSISTTTFFNTAFVPGLVHQDPRYFPLGGGPAKERLMWAVRSEFVGFGDDGHTMLNYANLVGFALSSIVANAYTPHSSTGYANTAKRYAIKIGVSTGMNVGREFGVFDRIKAIARHSKSAGN